VTEDTWDDVIGDYDDGCVDWSYFLNNQNSEKPLQKKRNTKEFLHIEGCVTRDDVEHFAISFSKSSNLLLDLEEKNNDKDWEGYPLFPEPSMRTHPFYITSLHLALCPGLLIDDSLITLLALNLNLSLRSLLLQVHI
jgi:hypothetical protein